MVDRFSFLVISCWKKVCIQGRSVEVDMLTVDIGCFLSGHFLLEEAAYPVTKCS